MKYLFNTGVSYPLAPKVFSENWKIGFNLGIGIERQLSGPWSGQLYFDYNNFEIGDEQFTKFLGFNEPGLSINGGTASILAVSANVKYLMGRARSGEAPYLIGGFGLYRFTVGDGSFATTDTTVIILSSYENTIGSNIGVGIDVRIGARTSFYIEGRYFLGFTNGNSTHHIPLRVGIIFK
jgi:hypothetical protein